MKTINCLFNQFSFMQAIRFSLLELVRRFINKKAYLAYSQTGEDILILNLLQSVKNGFYVEVGSNEPIHYSNTFGLYQKGWQGITVDANQKMVAMHKKMRPNDVAICAAISDEEKEVIFYEFSMNEISTINDNFYRKHKDTHQLVRQTKLITRSLNSILAEHLPVNRLINLLTIDVEGHDYRVLRSIDLKKYRPELIVIEMHNFIMLKPLANEIYTWMIENNYHLVGYAVWNGYFVANEYRADEQIN